MIPPSPWVLRWMYQIAAGQPVIDLACGRGRHAVALAEAGYPVTAVDRDAAALAQLAERIGITTRQADLEGEVWPLAGEAFAGVVVTHYLWRPRFDDVLALLRPGGVLIYETFMLGNERYGRPASPDFLLQPGELAERAAARGLEILGFEEGYRDSPKPAMVQALCARSPSA